MVLWVMGYRLLAIGQVLGYWCKCLTMGYWCYGYWCKCWAIGAKGYGLWTMANVGLWAIGAIGASVATIGLLAMGYWCYGLLGYGLLG